MNKHLKIYPVSFGFGWGIIAGIEMLLLVWGAARWGFAMPVVRVLGSLYYGVVPTFVGGLWGFFWGFIHCFIFGLLAAMIYNGTTKSFAPKGQFD
jgi:hypothetical protein